MSILNNTLQFNLKYTLMTQQKYKTKTFQLSLYMIAGFFVY